IQTGYDESTIGQIGVNIASRFGEPLTYARHLLWDIKDGSTYYGEFDVFMNDSFVTNNVPEIWLSSFGLTPTDSTAMIDIDGDGLLTWEEFYAGTSPIDADSVFKITENAMEGGQMQLHWKAVAGKTYSIEFKSELTDAEWTMIKSRIPGVEPQCSWSIPVSDNKGFFRIKVE
ncbi:MAG: hypothetical protein PF904_18580, partial [Kiritimatiellae bacterium]|nr:hypothetical protein [Kiritimatiellia bacterium]